MKKTGIIISVIVISAAIIVAGMIALLVSLFSVPDIDVISPEDGQEVVTANETIYSWCSTYDSLSAAAAAYMDMGDLYSPEPILLKWSVKESADSYNLKYSLSADLSDPVSLNTKECYAEINNLFVGKAYYWQVEAIYGDEILKSDIYTFKTAETPRAINIEGVSNTRDIGGYKVEGGKRIKQGLIYRGAYLNNISPNGILEALNDYKIKTDLDLRVSGEGSAGEKSVLGDAVNYKNINTAYYADIFTKENQDGIKNAVKIFADKNNYPIYMHCTLGRDRTGTLAFILGALLGMDKEQLFTDYDMSCFSVMGTYDSQTFSGMRSGIQSLYYRMGAYSDGTLSENTEKYLLDIGVAKEEISAIREIMLEEE